MIGSPTSSTHSTQTLPEANKSAPSSPTTTMTSADTAFHNHHNHDNHDDQDNDNNNNENSLDDIFGSSPETSSHLSSYNNTTVTATTTTTTTTTTTSKNEPSDLPALRRQHVTAGYRDGIAAAKAEHVQEGFDGGYPVGAQFGLRVGTVLGILEGVIKGLQGRDSSGPVKKQRPPQPGTKRDTLGKTETDEEKTVRIENIERLKRVYKTAVKELDVEALFGGLAADEDSERTPEDRMKAQAEPVLAKWERLVGVTAWEEHMEAVESMEDADEKTG